MSRRGSPFLGRRGISELRFARKRGAAWTMADLTGIAEDFDSRFGVTDVSGACSAWTGQIAGEVVSQGTAGNRPTIETRDSVQALLHTAASTQYLQGAFGTITLTQPLRAISVVEPVTASGTWGAIDGDDTAGRLILGASLGTWRLYCGVTLSSGLAVTAAAHALVGIGDGATSKIFVDDLTTEQASGDAGAHAADGLTVGAHFNATVPFDGYTFRAVLANGGDTSDHPDLGAYLESVYAGLTLTY